MTARPSTVNTRAFCSALVCWCTGERVAKSDPAAGNFAGLPDQDAPPQCGPVRRRWLAGVADAVGELLRERGAASAVQPGWRGEPRDQCRGAAGAALGGRLGLPLGHEVLIGALGLLGDRHLLGA